MPWSRQTCIEWGNHRHATQCTVCTLWTVGWQVWGALHFLFINRAEVVVEWPRLYACSVGRSVRCTTQFSNTVWNNFSLLYSSLDLNCAVSEPPFGPAPSPPPTTPAGVWCVVGRWKQMLSPLAQFHLKKMKNIWWWGWIYPFVCDLVAYRRISLHHSPTQSNRSSSTQLCVPCAQRQFSFCYLPTYFLLFKSFKLFYNIIAQFCIMTSKYTLTHRHTHGQTWMRGEPGPVMPTGLAQLSMDIL